jgi:hypothetical protein
MNLNVKDHVSNDKVVKFLYYRSKELWYMTELGLKFPVPIEDAGEATFFVEDRAMLFMRYIRKYIEKVKESEKMP